MMGTVKTSPKYLYDYQQNGWTVVNDVFTTKEVDNLLNTVYRVIESEVNDGNIHSMDGNQSDGFAPRKISSPFKKDDHFKNFVSKDKLQDLLEEFIGQKIALVSDQIFLKPPRAGSSKPYHQDNYYFKINPIEHVITAWIALEDVDEENGCLRYIDGSHRLGVVDHVQDSEKYNLKIEDKYLDRSKERPAIVKKGGVVFHHANTMHYSGPNLSQRWRRGYATHWVVPTVTSEAKDFIENGYFYQPRS